MPGFIGGGKFFHVTYSGLADFEKCPKLYFFRNIYRTPKTNKIMEILSPDLTLGNVVHNSIDEFTKPPIEKRNGEALKEIFYKLWPPNLGYRGGFKSADQENLYKEKAKEMLKRFYKNKEFSSKTPIRLPVSPTPKICLEKGNNIMLSGKTDWVEELPDKSLFVLDFKTGLKKEPGDSLQLPIYAYYVSEVKRQKVNQIGYWYLQLEEKPQVWDTQDLFVEERMKEVNNWAQKILLATNEKNFECSEGECRWCGPYEDLLKGRGQLVETTWSKELYIFV